MTRRSLLLVTALLGAALALPAAAQWKWRDRNGQTQYSDLPPPAGIADKDILARPAAATRPVPLPAAGASSVAASAPPAARGSDPDLEARRKQVEQAEADNKKKADEARVAATRAENCNRAREQMRTLDSGIRISRVNPNGEREVLDDAARAQESRRARDSVAADCR